MVNGYPDWQKGVAPARAQLMAGQGRVYSTANGSIAAASYADATIGTVPAGKQWLIGFLNVSCDKSVVQMVELFDNSAVFFLSDFDINLVVPFTGMGTYPMGEGHVLTLRFYNNDDATRTFRASIHITEVTV